MIRRTLTLTLLLGLAAALVVAVPATQAQSSCGAQYTVQPGDNLTRIAAVCGTTVEALRDANPGVISLIRPGDVLNIVSEQGGVSTTAVVAITPAAGPVGTQVTVVANGLPASTSVTVGIGQAGQAALSTVGSATDANGTLSATITVPSVDVGTQLVVTIITQDGTTSANSSAFTVNGTPFGVGGPNQTVFPAIPAPAGVVQEGVLFNRVNVYMVAAQGSGSTGVGTVCGDTIVPVQVAVNQTVAPLRAGISSLLQFSAADYGLPNLDNPLARTNLTIDEILIVNGEAIITLNGQLTSTGVCEDAQLRSQIEATALQYATVDRVTVFVNGIPIENILQ